MLSRNLRFRAPLLWLTLPYLAGLAFGKCGSLATPGALLAGAAVAALAALAANWRAPRVWAPALTVAVFLAGAASYAMYRQRLPDWEGLPARQVTLDLRIDHAFPGNYPDQARGLATVTGAPELLRELLGQRLYYTFTRRDGQPAPIRSAQIAVTGVLTPVAETPPLGSFEAYLADAGMNFEFRRGRLQAAVAPPTAYRQFCARLADRMTAILSAGLEDRPEIATVYRAMMLGQKHDLSDEQRGLFMHSGTMHLFAINGLHIGVVALTLHLLLALLRCPRRVACILVLAVLWLDVDTTGDSPSAVRAFLMVAMLEAAWALRQPINPLATLTAAALLTLAIDPLDFFSASFQMSYAVVLAIVLLGLPLGEWMRERWPAFRHLPPGNWRWNHEARAWLRRRLFDLLAIGGAATLVSAITGVQYFGTLATGGLLANLILVPLASAVITTGFISLVFGLIGMGWASWMCNEVAGLLLRLIETMIRVGTGIPGAAWNAQFRAEWIGPAALTLLVATLFAGYAWGWRKERGRFWPPVAVVALTLICGVKLSPV